MCMFNTVPRLPCERQMRTPTVTYTMPSCWPSIIAPLQTESYCVQLLCTCMSSSGSLRGSWTQTQWWPRTCLSFLGCWRYIVRVHAQLFGPCTRQLNCQGECWRPPLLPHGSQKRVWPDDSNRRVGETVFRLFRHWAGCTVAKQDWSQHSRAWILRGCREHARRHPARVASEASPRPSVISLLGNPNWDETSSPVSTAWRYVSQDLLIYENCLRSLRHRELDLRPAAKCRGDLSRCSPWMLYAAYYYQTFVVVVVVVVVVVAY